MVGTDALLAELQSHLQAPMIQLLGLTLVSVGVGEVTLRADPQDLFATSWG